MTSESSSSLLYAYLKGEEIYQVLENYSGRYQEALVLLTNQLQINSLQTKKVKNYVNCHIFCQLATLQRVLILFEGSIHFDQNLQTL